MKSYLFIATDRNGKRETYGRDAASIEHLRMMLEREGFTDIEFIDDEKTAELRAQRPEHLRPKTQEQFRFEANLRKGRDRKAILMQALRNNAPLLAVFTGLAAYGIMRQQWLYPFTALAAFAAWLVWFRARLVTGDTYDELLKAHARGELDKTEALIKKMRAAKDIGDKENIRVDLLFREAVLLARRGRLDDGLALTSSLKSNPQCTNGSFESRTSSIYYAAGRIDDFVRWQEQAYEVSSHAQLQTLDFAFVQARFGDVSKARMLLDSIEQRNLRAMHAAVFKAAEGTCLLRTKAYARACDELTAAVESLKTYSASAPTWPFQGIIAGYAAIALAKDGQREAARKLLAPWQQIALTCIDPQARKVIQAEVLG